MAPGATAKPPSTDSAQNQVMGYCNKLLALTGLALFAVTELWAQDLSPRAYLITPVHSNALNVAW